MARRTDSGIESLYDMARGWLETCLIGDGSLITPQAEVWTADHLDELEKHLIGQPDVTPDRRFLEKLKLQVAECSPLTVQLMAEIHVIHFLMISSGAISGAKKRSDVATILSWQPELPGLPERISTVLGSGIANPGQWALTRRDVQLTCLIRFSRMWKELDSPSQQAARSDPWAFRAIVDSVVAPSADMERLSLMYLLHPDTFEPSGRRGSSGAMTQTPKPPSAGSRITRPGTPCARRSITSWLARASSGMCAIAAPSPTASPTVTQRSSTGTTAANSQREPARASTPSLRRSAAALSAPSSVTEVQPASRSIADRDPFDTTRAGGDGGSRRTVTHTAGARASPTQQSTQRTTWSAPAARDSVSTISPPFPSIHSMSAGTRL